MRATQVCAPLILMFLPLIQARRVNNAVNASKSAMKGTLVRFAKSKISTVNIAIRHQPSKFVRGFQ